MAEYIDREALLEDIDAAQKNGGMGEVVAGTLKRYVNRQPAADVAPKRHELHKVVKLLESNYERGASWDYICDPVAWALYQTWREI